MITASGVYDIEIEAYHHDPNLCDAPSISASGLKAVAECPAKYWAFSPYNPQRFTKKSTDAFDFGRAAHALVLDEPEFNRYFIISPYADFKTKAAQEWRDDQTRTVVRPGEFEAVLAMAKAQRESAQCAQAFKRGQAERSLIHKDEETGIYLKSRPDWLPDDPTSSFIIDYKTAVSIEENAWAYDMHDYRYHSQAAMQIDAVRKVLGINPLGVAHVVQEKSPPYLCELRMVSPEQIEDGRYLYRRALRTFAKCMKSGHWPGYTAEPQFVPTPYKFTKLMEELRTNGTDTDANPTAAERQRAYSATDYLAAG